MPVESRSTPDFDRRAWIGGALYSKAKEAHVPDSASILAGIVVHLPFRGTVVASCDGLVSISRLNHCSSFMDLGRSLSYWLRSRLTVGGRSLEASQVKQERVKSVL